MRLFLAVLASALILLLLTASRPATVVRVVASIVVDSIQRQAVWTTAHIDKEVIEAPPSIADSDSTSAVIHERGMAWIQAPRQHVFPRAIFRLANAERGSAETLWSVLNELQAPTAFGISTLQRLQRHQCFVAAFTPATPHDVTLIAIGSGFNSSEQAEPLSLKISRGCPKYSANSHADSSRTGVDVVRGWESLSTALSLDMHFPINGGRG